MDADKLFVRGLFSFIAFCFTTVPIGYGLFTRNWFLIAGVILGALGTAIHLALKRK